MIQINFQSQTLRNFKASWLITCALKDPGFEKCHLDSIRGLFEKVLQGSYKVEGIESMDPVLLDKVQILQGTGPVSLDARLTNLKIKGLSKGLIIDNKANVKDKIWTTVFQIPKLRVEGNYQMNGQILVIPLNVS